MQNEYAQLTDQVVKRLLNLILVKIIHFEFITVLTNWTPLVSVAELTLPLRLQGMTTQKWQKLT